MNLVNRKQSNKMSIEKEIFLKLLQSIDNKIIDCEILEVWAENGSRRDIIYRFQEKSSNMVGQYSMKIDRYLEFSRNYKVDNLCK